MRKDWKYILYISAAFGLFVMVKLLSPRQYDWSITYSFEDKDPYGGYVFNQLLGSVFEEESINHSYKTLYELSDSLRDDHNLLVISSNFNGGKEDSAFLLRHVEHGGKVFISSQYFLGHFADTLGLSTSDYFFSGGEFALNRDTAALKLILMWILLRSFITGGTTFIITSIILIQPARLSLQKMTEVTPLRSAFGGGTAISF